MRPAAERIAEHLEEAEREAVAEWSRRARVPLEDWPSQAALRGLVDLAVLRAVDVALAADRARSWTHAVRLVSRDFRLSFDALDRRFRRQRTRRQKADTMSATGPSSACIVTP